MDGRTEEGRDGGKEGRRDTHNLTTILRRKSKGFCRDIGDVVGISVLSAQRRKKPAHSASKRGTSRIAHKLHTHPRTHTFSVLTCGMKCTVSKKTATARTRALSRSPAPCMTASISCNDASLPARGHMTL